MPPLCAKWKWFFHFWTQNGICKSIFPNSGPIDAGAEVDFVIYGEQGLCALEVKNARKVQANDLRGLRTFRQDYPEAQAALLHRGDERLRIDGIWCLPVEDFLRELRPNRELLRG